jgi:uncharacterized protein
MPRPRMNRFVSSHPEVTFFKPSGIPLTDLIEVTLSIDELEAVKLKDYLELDQIESAEKMGVSQSTFHRLLLSARKKIASALVKGKAIRIQGGNFEVISFSARGKGFGRGRRWM